MFHLRATNEIERQRWVTALELAKAKAIKMLECGEKLCQQLYIDAITVYYVLYKFLSNVNLIMYWIKHLVKNLDYHQIYIPQEFVCIYSIV